MPGALPVALLVNSSKLRAVFGTEKFKKVNPPPLDLGLAGGARTRARVQTLEGVTQDLDDIRYVLHPETDEAARDACIAAGQVTLCA